jgi:DNA-binding NarL/FixJ family response regulator
MTATTSQIKLAIVDDHNLFRKGLIKLISLGDKDNRYTILFEAADGNDLKEKLNKNELPAIVLMDIEMPDMDGYEAVAWLKKEYPSISILVVSMFESNNAILKMLELGVNGYLSKDIEVEDMHAALEAIAGKGHYYSDFVVKVMAQTLQNTANGTTTGSDAGNTTAPGRLTENELKFLQLACTELTYQEIADKMILSPKTIDTYRDTLFQRFKVKNRVSLAMYAVKNGLVKV